MTDQEAFESEMSFIRSAGIFFHLDKSEAYVSIKEKNDGVKMTDFLILRQSSGANHEETLVEASEMLVVEAKKSAPNPENQVGFDGFLTKIQEQLTNGFFLGLSACLGRNDKAARELPDEFKNLNLAATRFELVLVIKNHQDEWLSPLKDALDIKLHSLVDSMPPIWNLGKMRVSVFNENMAKECGLVA
ncbi:hypothetical protein LLH00_15435 [bacterium]|nr:hypothetical protein [bacterium]